jgi:hypothetical protein
LKKAWIGYKIAKREGDYDKMVHYSEGIQKFQKQLNVPVPRFPELDRIELSHNKKKK